jgi:hypothetical protein
MIFVLAFKITLIVLVVSITSVLRSSVSVYGVITLKARHTCPTLSSGSDWVGGTDTHF